MCWMAKPNNGRQIHPNGKLRGLPELSGVIPSNFLVHLARLSMKSALANAYGKPNMDHGGVAKRIGIPLQCLGLVCLIILAVLLELFCE